MHSHVLNDDNMTQKCFLHYWHFVRWIHQSPVERCSDSMFSMLLAWTKCWTNSSCQWFKCHNAHVSCTVHFCGLWRQWLLTSSVTWQVRCYRDKNVEGGVSKSCRQLLNLRALKISILYENHIFQCMGKIFCVEFQRVPLKFHTKYLSHTLNDVDFIHRWKFKSS